MGSASLIFSQINIYIIIMIVLHGKATEGILDMRIEIIFFLAGLSNGWSWNSRELKWSSVSKSKEESCQTKLGARGGDLENSNPSIFPKLTRDRKERIALNCWQDCIKKEWKTFARYTQ